MVDRTLDPLDGDIVAVDVDGERSFKVWSRIEGRVRLAYANLRYGPRQSAAARKRTSSTSAMVRSENFLLLS